MISRSNINTKPINNTQHYIKVFLHVLFLYFIVNYRNKHALLVYNHKHISLSLDTPLFLTEFHRAASFKAVLISYQTAQTFPSRV